MKTEKSKLSGYLLIAVFVVPLLIAMLMYAMRDYVPTVKSLSHGELIHPAQPITIFELQQTPSQLKTLDDIKGKWTYLIYSPNACTLECEASLFKLRQTKIATGRESNRIQSVLIVGENKISSNILDRNKRTHVGKLLKFELENQPGFQKQLQQGMVYLVDPNGNLMMQYDTTSTSRGMLKDIKKLLKISNIG
ncbi:MAG: hypothetical protein R8G33_10230 [Gammaproteobacteria bacterium]|nr:hypothetical protein [Gammaproteobacteria bacterium]